MLEKLSPRQEEIVEEVFREYDRAPNNPMSVDMDHVKKTLARIYSFWDMKLPDKIEWFDSPAAALKRATEITGTEQKEPDFCGIADSGWIAFYDFFGRPGVEVLTAEENKDIYLLRDFQRMVWDIVLCDDTALLIRYPEELHRDSNGAAHSATGPCCKWKDGVEDYAWHGVLVDKRVILDPKSYTKDEYLAITNTEERRALGEAAGWDHIVTMLGASKTDGWTDPVTKLSYELWGNGESQWIRKQSPRLKTDTQPYYFEPVHEDLKTAQAARKWQACPELSVAECEKDPVLVYEVEA